MKKFTALMLVALLVVMAFPFASNAATATKVGTVAELAAIADGDYELTADIDLSKATWTTIPEFSGTLDGNGYTITMPTDAPVFGKITGTVKNVNLKGTVTLGAEDVSTDKYVFITSNVDLVAAGTLANVVDGGTVEQVTSDLNVTFNLAEADKTVVGGLVGIVRSESAEKAATIKNVLVKGSVKSTQKTDNNAETFGGLVGGVEGNVLIDTVDVQSSLVITSCQGNRAGVAGYVNEGQVSGTDAYRKPLAVITNTVFSGSATVNGETLSERFGGIVGYGRSFTLKNSAVTATITDEVGSAIDTLVGYCNASKDWHAVVVENCLVTGTRVVAEGATANTNNAIVRIKGAYSTLKGFIYVTGDKLNKESLAVADAVEKPTAAEATTAFVALEGNADIYEVVGGKLTVKNVGKTNQVVETLATNVKLEIAADGVVTSDFTGSNHTTPPALTNGTATVEFVETNGVDNSSSMKITRAGYRPNAHFEVRFALTEKGALGANKYLVVWADFTNVEFRKASFGLIENNEAYPYRTDDKAGSNELPFYYLADGATEWETLKHGSDQCFGADANDGGSSVKGKKGYFAFPVADFVKGETAKTPLTSESIISDVYFFGTFAKTDYDNVPFYFDDFQLVEDYTTVNAPVVPDTPDTPDAPVTGDMTIALAGVAVVALAAVTVIAKKKVTE